ncbi:hypothetical protein Ciccas_014118 [Cichlidogyrus casuarinus]|uniref:Uncharacterized protein n=1 Tax=Cichlidogyrus casuarinus TaxID=1844966 RepID=A0ABD2PKL3_9PLAT
MSLCVLSGILCFLLVEKTVRIFKGDHSHSHATPGKKSKELKEEQAIGFKTSGYLNLAADFSHNFTDGLAIAASFLVSRNVGLVTTVTVLVHELPHEIGDFAILIQAGCTPTKAIMLQFITAVGALMGAIFSLVTVGVLPAMFSTKDSSNLPVAHLPIEQMTSKILPFTAGGFIYIALVTVIPDLLSTSQKSSIWQNLIELFAMLLGIMLMVIVGMYE